MLYNSCYAVYNFLFARFAEDMYAEHQHNPALQVMQTISLSSLNLLPLSYAAYQPLDAIG